MVRTPHSTRAERQDRPSVPSRCKPGVTETGCARRPLACRGRPGGVATLLVLALALATGITSTLPIAEAHAARRWPAADRLVAIYAVWPDRRTDPEHSANWDRSPIAWSMWQALRRTPAFDDIGVWAPRGTMALGGRDAASVSVIDASSSLLAMLGARPAVGRLFTPEEDYAPSRTALLSHEAWQRHFAGRRDIAGLTVALGPVAGAAGAGLVEIAGVLAPDVRFPRASPDVLLSVGRSPDATLAFTGFAVGQLRRDTTVAEASAVVARFAGALGLPARQTARVVLLGEDQR